MLLTNTLGSQSLTREGSQSCLTSRLRVCEQEKSPKRVSSKPNMRDDHAAMSLPLANGRDTLPKNVKPIHYDLTLEPNAETLELAGSVTIA